MYKEEEKDKEQEKEGEAQKSDSGYPASNGNTEVAAAVIEDKKLSSQNCCCGLSTDVDQIAKSKKNSLAIEGKWTHIVQSKSGISLKSL